MKTFTFNFLIILAMLGPVQAFCVPPMNSHPSASATIFLDFDGHRVSGSFWNNGNPINCAPSGLTDEQIIEVFNRVSEDYRPFDINITTDSVRFLNAPLAKRIRVIVTPTSSWRPGVGGIAYIGSFTWGDDTPAFVFSDRLGPNSPKYIAECCSHESGHTLGLAHQSSYDNNCNLVETYNTGAGSGETGWAPVMGNSYYKNMTGWNDGPTPYGCASVQDNLTTITSINGFSYRPDDYTADLNEQAYSLGGSSFSVDGIISTSTDQDAFRFSLSQAGNLHLEAKPFSINGYSNTGANLDIKISLYDGQGSLLRVYDPVSMMSVTIDTSLQAGTYFFVLDGSGNQNTSNYGSLGSYRLTGFRGALPIRDISLSGRTDKASHILQWNIIADEPIESQEVEASADGASFHTIANLAAGTNRYTVLNPAQGLTYYRIKATSVISQTAVSNVIALKNAVKENFVSQISTLVHNEINIRTLDAYQYRLFDTNGRVLQTGRRNSGQQQINMQAYPSGLYILQIHHPEGVHTERIVKK